MAGVLMNCAGRSEAARAQMAAAGCSRRSSRWWRAPRRRRPTARPSGADRRARCSRARSAPRQPAARRGDGGAAARVEPRGRGAARARCRGRAPRRPSGSGRPPAWRFSLLGAPADNEALLEDAARLDRVAKADADAPAELQAAGALATIVPLLDNPNEEPSCMRSSPPSAKGPDGRRAHRASLPRRRVEARRALRSSAEEVQEVRQRR